jgi:hypothetical protein
MARLPHAYSVRRDGRRVENPERVLFFVEDVQAVFGFLSANRANYIRALKRPREIGAIR